MPTLLLIAQRRGEVAIGQPGGAIPARRRGYQLDVVAIAEPAEIFALERRHSAMTRSR